MAPSNATRQHLAQTQHPPPPKTYKYIRGATGVVGSITNVSGLTSIDLLDVENVVGGMRAEYLDVHGYGAEVMKIIVDAFQSANTMEEFVSGAEGCGMSVVELEWFWELSWHF